MWPSHGLIIIDVTRLTYETLPILSLANVNAILANSFNFLCPEDPSHAIGISILVTCVGSYECLTTVYLGPVNPGLSMYTSTSYVPILHFMGTLTPVESKM